MIDGYYYKDKYGVFDILAELDENEYMVQYRKYVNSPEIKSLGGMYALHCPETGKTCFYRNEYMAMHALNKFCDDTLKEVMHIEQRAV